MSGHQRALGMPGFCPASDEEVIARAIAALDRRLRALPVMTTSKHVQQYLRLRTEGLTYEVFGVLFLDAQNRMLAYEQMFRGTLTQTSVYPREVVRRALDHNAATVILHHNHPSGTVEPSRADEALTQTLKAALSLVDCRVLDHIITSDVASLSMAERGLL